jgi:hypothetical protein
MSGTRTTLSGASGQGQRCGATTLIRNHKYRCQQPARHDNPWHNWTDTNTHIRWTNTGSQEAWTPTHPETAA